MAKYDKKIRALTTDRELNEEYLTRDTRSAVQKFFDWLKLPNNMGMLLVFLGLATFFVPQISDFTIFFAVPFFWYGMKQEESAPLKMPIQSKFPDKNQPHPATGAPTAAEGIFFIGNEMKSNKEVWVTNSDARQHFLVVGTTGAGKAQPLGFHSVYTFWAKAYGRRADR